MKTLKDLLKEKIPSEYHNTVEFAIFLKLVGKSKAKTLNDVKLLIYKDIGECKNILEKQKKSNLEGTNRRILSEHAMHLKLLEKIEKLFLPCL